MHGSAGDRRALEREALRNVIASWNANRLDLFELSEPNEDLEFHGVMRFYFQDSGQKVATKCIRVASDATVTDVIGTLVEKFRPDMRMLSVPSYALYELHERCPERKLAPDEKPLLVQLNWHVDDREGRFLLRNIDDKASCIPALQDSNSSFRRKLSKREKKQLKKQEKLSRMKSENDESGENKDGVAEKLYTELPETSFTRSISNPEAVMRRRRQQKLERKLQQFRSKDGGPDTGGTLKIYGEALCRDVPYKTLLLSVRDCAGAVVREMLDKYGLSRADPTQWCLVQVTTPPGGPDTEYVLDDDECPLSILMNHSQQTGSIMFHVRRRPADCAPRKRKKKPGALGAGASREPRGDCPLLVELGPDGQAPHPSDTARTLRLTGDMMEVGSANGIALQLYGPHIQPRHCVINNNEGITTLQPCHADAHVYVNNQRIYQTTALVHGSIVRFGHSNTYRFLDPAAAESRPRHIPDSTVYDRSPRALSPAADTPRENYETTFDLEGNVETVSTASAREDNRSLGSASENRLDRYPRGQDPILPAVLEFPEEPQEQFLARVISHLDVGAPSFKLAPAYTLYLCARYRASTHYRPELTPTERAHKLTLLLQHAANLQRRVVTERANDSHSQAFWLANTSELLHFLKSDRHVSAFSLQAQDTLADAVQAAFRNLVTCLTDELHVVMNGLLGESPEDQPREVVVVLNAAMSLLRKCRVNAALTIQLFSQLFHWISARALSTIISNPVLCTRGFGQRLFTRLQHLQQWAESQGLELAAECHLAKIVQCAHLLQAPKYSAEELAGLSAACFKLNSLQLRALLTQYKAEPGEQVAAQPLLEQAARAAEGVADELARGEGREVRLHEDPAPPLQLLLPDDGFSCDVVQGVPAGLADFLQPLQAAGLCRLAGQPTSSGHWTVYMSAPRPASALSTTQPEVQLIRLHKAGGGMGLSIVAAKGAGQERLGIYIKSVVAGGAADRDGRLAAGDQLLSVDGQSLLGITQERAAEFLVRTGSIVTLEVAKGGAVYHGLATLLQQPSPTPPRGPRRMSERDLPSRVDSERSIPASKSVPALHHISPGAPHDVFNPGYSRTSSSNSINAPQQNGPRSRSTHNLNQQQDSGFYQNLSVYRNKMPSPQQLADRSSALRSSQNSLHSTNTQRPTSAYYPPAPSGPLRPHQSIPNLKSPSVQRLHNEDPRTGPYPRSPQEHPQLVSPPYGGQRIENQYPQPQTQQPQLITTNGGQRHEDLRGYNAGLLREMPRHEDMMRYPSTNNVRIQEAQIQHNNKLQSEELSRNNEMRTSKSEDMLRHHLTRDDGLRYASSSNNIHNNQLNASLRGQAKMAEMGEEVKRRQNRIVGYPNQQPQNQQMPYPQQYQQQQQQQQFNNTVMQQYNYQQQPMSPTYPPKQAYQPMQQMQQQPQQQYQPPTAIMQNLSLNQSYGTPPTAPKPVKKPDDVPPELPPTSTHPLYSASSQEPPKGAFYPNPANQGKQGPANPWEREERERQMELRRQHARQWQEQQIQELSSITHRSSQQEEQLRALRLEREFQRRAMEAAQDDEDTEKEVAASSGGFVAQQPPPLPTTTGAVLNNNVAPHISPPSILKLEPDVPPPPERGSSYTVMSLRNSKRVSFNDTSAAANSNNQSATEEIVREDPNSFILQAESMLASPTTPTDSGMAGATPGVIGAQEVYRDPRTRRLAEQAQQKVQQSPIPEKLSFKEKMKMFAMETGEAGTPKDKSKISRAQRDIDNLTPSSSLVH